MAHLIALEEFTNREEALYETFTNSWLNNTPEDAGDLQNHQDESPSYIVNLSRTAIPNWIAVDGVTFWTDLSLCLTSEPFEVSTPAIARGMAEALNEGRALILAAYLRHR